MGNLHRSIALAGALAAAVLSSAPNADARSSSTRSYSTSHHVTTPKLSTPKVRAPRASTPSYVQHDSRGRIKRSAEARDSFKHSHPCPSTGRSTGACPGYVIDHVTALKRGGADSPSNMQWQTKAAAKAKDKIE